MTGLLNAISGKVFTECDLVAALGVGFLIGTLYTLTVLMLLHKLQGVF
jgi:hypothetical protein